MFAGMIFFAFCTDLLVYALAGWAIAHFGRHRLPVPWNQPAVVVPIVMCVGALFSLLTFPHWLIKVV